MHVLYAIFYLILLIAGVITPFLIEDGPHKLISRIIAYSSVTIICVVMVVLVFLGYASLPTLDKAQASVIGVVSMFLSIILSKVNRMINPKDNRKHNHRAAS
jgi:purine-cytosine permease-like protein